MLTPDNLEEVLCKNNFRVTNNGKYHIDYWGVHKRKTWSLSVGKSVGNTLLYSGTRIIGHRVNYHPQYICITEFNLFAQFLIDVIKLEV